MNPQSGLALLMSLGMCVIVPLGLIAAWVYVVNRRAADRHAERMAMIAQGLVPPDAPAARATVRAEMRSDRRRDPARRIGWAVGFLVAGVLWLGADSFDLNPLGILFTAIGAAYLTRGILGSRRSDESRNDGGLPPGDIR